MTAVLGGGLSGLSAAFYALENPKLGSVVVLEASNRLGGWISTKKSPSGAIFEQGPRTVRPQGPAGQNTLQLVDEMKLSNKIHPIPITHPAAIRRLIYMDKQLHPIPFNLKSFFIQTPPFKRPLYKVVWNDVTAPSIQKDDESLYSFIERRLGADIADYIISPMICGICAGDAKQISVHFLMSSVFEAAQKHGSIFRGILKENIINNFLKSPQLHKTNPSENKHMGSAELSQKSKWAVWGLEGGLEQLPQALANNLFSKNVHIHLGTECKELTFKSDYIEVRTGGDTKKYKRVVSSLPAKVLAPLVVNQHPQLAVELEAIPSVTVALVNLEFSEKVLSEEAFGFLVPPCEELPILGVIFDSCIFPQKSTVSFGFQALTFPKSFLFRFISNSRILLLTFFIQKRLIILFKMCIRFGKVFRILYAFSNLFRW